MNPHRNNDDDNNIDREQHDDRHDHAEADNLFTLSEVARLLRIPPATLRYWRHQHTGPRSFRIGRHVRYSRTDVEEWLRKQRDADGPASGSESRRHLFGVGTDRVVTDHRIMGGVPCIAGTRIPVVTIVGLIAQGLTTDDVVRKYLQLGLETSGPPPSSP